MIQPVRYFLKSCIIYLENFQKIVSFFFASVKFWVITVSPSNSGLPCEPHPTRLFLVGAPHHLDTLLTFRQLPTYELRYISI